LARKILADRRKNGRIDLEAVEMLVRESIHRAGATALSHLLHQDPPESPAIPCSCGHSARYKELRCKPVLTVVVGSDSAFEVGREQLELLAGLQVSTKSVERQAERIGAEIIRLEQAEIQRGLQLDLAMPPGPPSPSSTWNSTAAVPR
jgi:hypothetical protein